MIDPSSSDEDEVVDGGSSSSNGNGTQVGTSVTQNRLAPGPSFDTVSSYSGTSGFEGFFQPHSRSPRCSPRGSPRCSPPESRVSALPTQPYPESGPTIDSEDEERRSLLQLYVLVARCIAYPFANRQNADKLPVHGVRATEATLKQLRERFQSFLEGRTRLGGNVDVAIQEAMRIYHETVLMSSDVAGLIRAGGWKVENFTGVFRAMLPRMLSNLELDESTETRVTTVWLQRFSAICRTEPGLSHQDASSSCISVGPSCEMVLTPEQLYEVFQSVLRVKRFEHQILFNQCQLGNKDEQASLLGRELRCREKMAEAVLPKSQQPVFVNSAMSTMYLKEEQVAVQRLLKQLDFMSVQGSSRIGTAIGRVRKSPRNNRGALSSQCDLDAIRSDIVMPFNVEVLVMEARGLQTLGLSPKRLVYAVMKVDGCHEKMMTDRVESDHLFWETQGDFATTVPRPHVRIDIYAESNSFLELEDKRLGKLILHLNSVQPTPLDWYPVECHGHNVRNPPVEVRAQVKIDRPDSMKKFGFLYVKGTNCWKKLKCRYLVLVQMTARSFALCSFEERQSSPTHIVVVEGYTVDYCEPQYIGGSEDSNKYIYQFMAEKEGDQILFGCQEERDRQSWVMALYRATGQNHKPEPVLRQSNDSRGSNVHTETVIRRIGLDDFLLADVGKFDHQALFAKLQMMTLSYRLSESSANMGWLSPGQTYVLEEYCSRYGVRMSYYHLCLLQEQLDRAWHGTFIDPGLMHFCYTYVDAHLRGLKPDGFTGSVLLEEKQWFERLRDNLRAFMLRNLRTFRSYFPFGYPENALKSTLSMLEKITITDTLSSEMHASLKAEIYSCMKTAALNCFNSISSLAAQKLGEWMVQEQSNNDGDDDRDDVDQDSIVQVDIDVHSMDYVVVLGQLSIELCQEIEDFHGDAFKRFRDSMWCCIETIWELYYYDMQAAVNAQPRYSYDVFRLFYRLNAFFTSHKYLCDKNFHRLLHELYLPRVVDYVNHLEMDINHYLKYDLRNEKWQPPEGGQPNVRAFENLLQRLETMTTFLAQLQWSEPDFRDHLEMRAKRMTQDCMESFAQRTHLLFCGCFQTKVSEGSFQYVVPMQPCVMLNVVCALELRLKEVHTTVTSPSCTAVASDSVETNSESTTYREDVGEVVIEIKEKMIAKLIIKLTVTLESLLSKLARYDPGSVLSSLRSLVAPKLDVIKLFVHYVSCNLTEVDSLLFADRQQFKLAWYNVMCKKVLDFVNKRSGSLVLQQITFIGELLEQLLHCFLEYGFIEQDLKTQFYTMVVDRIQYEVSAGDLLSAVNKERAERDT